MNGFSATHLAALTAFGVAACNGLLLLELAGDVESVEVEIIDDRDCMETPFDNGTSLGTFSFGGSGAALGAAPTVGLHVSPARQARRVRVEVEASDTAQVVPMDAPAYDFRRPARR